MRSVAKALAALGLAAFLGWGGLALYARSLERAAMAACPPAGQILDVNGQRLHAEVSGQGPDLVLIHGASGNTGDFDALVAQLAADFRVIVFDRPGMGHSDPLGTDGGSLSEQARLLQAAAAQLGADRPIVLGQSYGGAVALAWAVERPGTLAGLVTVSAVSQPWPQPVSGRRKLIAHPVLGRLLVPYFVATVDDDRIGRILDRVFAPQPVPEEYAAAICPRLSLSTGSLRANALQRVHLKEQIRALQPHYGDIAVPVAILHGTADPIVPLASQSDVLAAGVPGATFAALDGIGHMPHHVAIPRVVAALDDVARRAGLRPGG